MIVQSKIIKKIIFCFWLLGLVTCGFFEPQIFAVDDSAYRDHGWAMLDSVRSVMPYPVTFYAMSRGLQSRMHDGMIVRIKSLKTGFGSYYKLEKDNNGVWALRAKGKNPKELSSQFLVSISDKYITLTSEVADGFLLASTPDFNVTLVNEKDVKSDSTKTDSTLWELTEDPNSGDTLDSCYLKNKATGGLLTASYDSSDSSGGNVDAQITNLKAQIDPLEKATPYLTITYAMTQAASIAKGGTDIKDILNQKIKDYVIDPKDGSHVQVSGAGGVLEILPTAPWIEQWTGLSKGSWNAWHWTVGQARDIEVHYTEGADNTEKTYHTTEDADMPNPLFYIKADPTKHPAWPLRQKLIALANKSQEAGALNLKNSDIAHTGYGTTPFDPNQWSKVAIEPVVDLGEDSNVDTQSITIAAAQEGGSVVTDLKDKAIWIHKHPEFEGYFKETQDFGPGDVITVNPLNSKGYVWLDKTFQTAGYGAVTFRAFTQDSDIQICFTAADELHAVYRIVFGAQANTKTVIYKNDVPVQEITNDQSTRARISPGKIESFWVSLNNGFIIIGKRDPGTNVIMAWQDPNPPANVKQIGFSTYKSVVKYTDVQIIDNPIVVVAPTGKAYATDSSPIQVGTLDAPAWHRLPLSPPSVGTVVFQATGSEEATLILANDKNEGYAITFGSDGNTTSKIVALENQQELFKIDAKSTPFACLDAGGSNKFWVSFYKGMIILGKGDIGKNTFCVYVDNTVDSNGNSTVPDGICKIGFAGNATLQNLEIWPEVTLGFDQNVAQFVKQHQNIPVQGKLNIISPFDYAIYQEGPAITFQNRITGMSTYIAGTPDSGLIYHFTLDIGKDGSPDLIPGQNVKTAEKIVLETAVKVLQAAQDTIFNQVMMTAYEASQENDPIEGWITGPLMLCGASAIGAAGAAVSATQSAIQAKLDESSALANRQINTEKIIRMAGGSTAVSDEAKNNRQAFESALLTIFGPLPGDPKDPNSVVNRDAAGKLDYKTGLWDGALRLITDAYVVADPEKKKSVISGLSDLYNGVIALGLSDDTSLIYNRMMNILIKAYNNAYLTSFGDLFDDANRHNWYIWINNLAKQFFGSQEFLKKGVEINFKGEYLWFPISFSQAGSGSLTFEVQAQSDVFVCFSENPVQSSDMLKHIYEIVFGAWDNKLTVIRRENLGDDVIEFDNSNLTDLSPDPMIFKKYWINIDNGTLSGGVGELGQNKLWEWTDPYTPVAVKWFGFSNWLSAITIRNVQVGASIGKSVGSNPVTQPAQPQTTDVDAS